MDVEILDRLDIAAEYAALGLKILGDTRSSNGWIPARAMGRDDRTPSAGINIHTGRYKDHGGDGDNLSLYHFAAKWGPFATPQEARQHYADKTGVSLRTSSRRQKHSPVDSLEFVPWNETIVRLWCRRKPPITSETVRAAGGRLAYHRFKKQNYTVVALPVFSPPFLPDRQPCGWVMWNTSGGTLPTKHGAVKIKTTFKSTAGLVGKHLLNDLAKAKCAWKFEGPFDMLAGTVVLPDGHIAVTNSGGANENPREEIVRSFSNLRVNVVGDCDQPGQNGADKWSKAIARYATETRNVKLPFPIEENHGKDFRDFINAGHTLDELVALAEKTTTLPRTTQFARTDLGNAGRLVARYGSDLRYCFPWQRALVWDGKRWALDETGAAERLAKRAVKDIFNEAARSVGDDEREEVARWAIRSQSAQRIAAMLRLAYSEPGIPILPDEMDTETWMLNVANGTIDLRTGELKPHDRSQLFTKICPVSYLSANEAECPLWHSFLGSMFNDDGDIVDYIQRLVGQALPGVIQEHLLPIFYGEGGNGKSTFLNTLVGVLGDDYAMKASKDLLVRNKHEGHPTELCDLFGKRFVVAIETEGRKRLAESLVKELTGGDPIRARRMRENFWQFSPSHSIFLATNHKPTIIGTDSGIWRRVKLIPCDLRLPPDKVDKELFGKLKAEYAGILRWAVDGCVAWQREGLAEPDKVTAATSAYRSEQDDVGRFVDECCRTAPGLQMGSSDLQDSFTRWAGYKLTARRIREEMERLGFTQGRFSSGPKKGRMCYEGLGLRSEWEPGSEGSETASV